MSEKLFKTDAEICRELHEFFDNIEKALKSRRPTVDVTVYCVLSVIAMVLSILAFCFAIMTAQHNKENQHPKNLNQKPEAIIAAINEATSEIPIAHRESVLASTETARERTAISLPSRPTSLDCLLMLSIASAMTHKVSTSFSSVVCGNAVSDCSLYSEAICVSVGARDLLDKSFRIDRVKNGLTSSIALRIFSKFPIYAELCWSVELNLSIVSSRNRHCLTNSRILCS